MIGAAALTLSPWLIVWCGAVIVAGWWAAFTYVVSGMERTLSWADLPPSPTAEQYAAVLLDPDFIARGNRFEETISLVALTLLLAIAVGRARGVVRNLARSQEERAFAERAFGRFVPQPVVEALLRDRSSLAPVRRDATVMFLDVRGFTSISEGRTPEAVIDMLNELFDVVGEVISRHGGVITNLQGDAVLAAFNLPVALVDHAKAACAAARDLVAAVDAQQFAGESLSVRIGINTGEVAAGSTGGRNRQTYTLHGDAVNLAARLEQANKEFDTQILVSERTAQEAEVHDALPRGAITVRGRQSQVAVYSLA